MLLMNISMYIEIFNIYLLCAYINYFIFNGHAHTLFIYMHLCTAKFMHTFVVQIFRKSD